MTLRGNQTLAELQATFARAGRLNWIGLRERTGARLSSVDVARMLADRGIEGDHRARRRGGKRQVTLIQHEHLPVIARLAHRREVAPELLRRNLVVSGINLLALRTRRFTIGRVMLEGSGLCHPCSRMEETLGGGGYNAMRGHGGITAVVLVDGEIRLGDRVTPGEVRRLAP